jgi:hypothetical protein
VAAADVVDRYLDSLSGEVRRLARAEWGLTIPADEIGEPLDIGLSLADGLLRVKASALGPAEGLDPWVLLWWNRQTRLVRFGSTRSREVWVHADLPVAAVDETALDRLLGLVVEAAVAVRRLGAGGPEEQ